MLHEGADEPYRYEADLDGFYRSFLPKFSVPIYPPFRVVGKKKLHLVPATSRPYRPITFTDSPAGISSTLSDSPPITFTDLPDDSGSWTRQATHEALLFQTASQLPSRTRQTTPPLRQPALTGPVHAFSVHFSAPPNTFNIFILRQKCSRIALVRFRLERLQKLTFYNQTNEEN